MKSPHIFLVCFAMAIGLASPFSVSADNLFQENKWAEMSTDRKAANVGDILFVIIAETAEARNSARNASGKSMELNGDINTSGVNHFGQITLGSNYSGRGDVRRSESLLTSISVSIDQVFPNGDYLVSGTQRMHVNGEWTTIGVRGRIREQDISSDNQVFSNRIANAEINYDGQGFVSRGSRPGIIARLFSFLGLV